MACYDSPQGERTILVVELHLKITSHPKTSSRTLKRLKVGPPVSLRVTNHTMVVKTNDAMVDAGPFLRGETCPLRHESNG